MLRIFVLGVWALAGLFLVKSYVSGVGQIPQFEEISQKALADAALGGPFAGYKNMGDLGIWFHISAAIVFLLYASFSIQILKEFGPSAKNPDKLGPYPTKSAGK